MKRILTVTLLVLSTVAFAEVKMPCVFGDHMVLQRDRSVAVYGTAAAGEKVTVIFGSQTLSATADARGNWRVDLAPMPANAIGQRMKISGTNTITFNDVLVGDVWICSGQSNMDMRLGGCKRPEDIASANFPGIRHFTSSGGGAEEPLKEPRGGAQWVISTPGSASSFTAVGFYFARKLQQELKGSVPLGLMLAAVGGTKIDLWLAPEGIYDIPVLHPLLKHRPLTDGTYSLYNGMVAPLAPYGARGILWYQGENAEISSQSPESYYLKMKALSQGWKRVWGQDDMAFYLVMLANYGELQPTVVPVLKSGGWDADTRLQQVMAMALPHAGCASAMDIGISKVSWAGYHPENKLDIGERLALWALKNEYGRTNLVTSGPVLRNVALAGNTVVCTFDYVGGGLMVGSKKWYEPTKEVPDGKLQRFCIAGADGKWQVADAVIKETTVILSSPTVASPRKVSYACWQNPEGANLYNKEGLPALPFHVEDVTAHYTIAASAGEGGQITPAGSASYLSCATTLYTIMPAAGYFIQDVKIDGVSVGSVRTYTFDPLQKDHTIVATFKKTAPSYTITATANGGGSITPTGSVTVAQGGSATFSIVPEPGNRAVLTVDGVPVGPRDRFTFADARTNHTVSTSFSCTIAASAGYGGTITPSGTLAVEFGGRQSFKIAPLPGYSIGSVTVDGADAGKVDSYAFNKVTASHCIAVKFKSSGAMAGSIPCPEQLIFACRGEALPASGNCAEWPAHAPEGKRFAAIGSPTVEMIDGCKYANIPYERAPGFTVGSYSEPIPCNGASIVLAVRPVRNGVHAGWASIVDVFYDRLVLGIRGDNGLICVRRNGGVEDSKTAVPDGQITILSLIVQPDGSYKVYANGAEVHSGRGDKAMDQLVPGVAGPFAKQITIGRNAPDAWTAFNGQIGDVFLYKNALSEAERRQVEGFIAKGLEGKP
jgi:sialate O-acetylesterase